MTEQQTDEERKRTGAGSRRQTGPDRPRTRWRDLLPVAAPLLAFVSVAAYAIMRTSYERFYAQFGLAPEDVGANSTTILAESGGRVFVYSLLFAIVPYALTLCAFYVLMQLEPVRLRSWLAVVVLALLPLALYQELTGGGIIGGYVGVVLLALMVLALWTRHRGIADARWGHVVLLWLGFGVIWLNIHYLPDAAARAGRCVVNKEHVEERLALRFVHTRRSLPGHGSTAVLSLRVEPADVTWIGDSAGRPSFGPHTFYLGQAAGTVVLYDASRARAIRVPASSVLISTQRQEKFCRDTAQK
jgi:hypothetical protein